MKVGKIVFIVGGRGFGQIHRRLIQEASLVHAIKQQKEMERHIFGELAEEANKFSKAMNGFKSVAEELKLINILPDFEVTSSQLKIQLKAARKKKRGFLEIQQLERELSKKLREERSKK